jgi:hypothetical protein
MKTGSVESEKNKKKKLIPVYTAGQTTLHIHVYEVLKSQYLNCL